MSLRHFVGVPAALALLCAPAVSRAQSCASLRAQLTGNTGDFLGIAADYPRTHAAIIACLVGNERDDEAFACAAAMVIGACLGMGAADCDDLTSRWERASRAYMRITSRMRALGCRQ